MVCQVLTANPTAAAALDSRSSKQTKGRLFGRSRHIADDCQLPQANIFGV
jgi:hypothetical protein